AGSSPVPVVLSGIPDTGEFSVDRQSATPPAAPVQNARFAACLGSPLGPENKVGVRAPFSAGFMFLMPILWEAVSRMPALRGLLDSGTRAGNIASA
ncbi:hypothetical protein, partial [Actinotignum sp. GS-2025e]|uniref:hypothetical protein n=1 Tax=Actinotignum sp. GS-2025e TaxID=3427278 RepID=UPI003F4696DA